MPYNVTIAAGHNGIVLPNGESYNAGDVAALTDVQYHQLSAEFKAVYISGISGADTTGPAGPAGSTGPAGPTGPAVDILFSDQGGGTALLAETWDPMMAGTGTGTNNTTGQIVGGVVRLQSAVTVTGIRMWVNTASVTPTAGATWTALYHSGSTQAARTLVASVSDDNMFAAATAWKNEAFSSPQALAAGLYIIAICSTASTPGTLLRLPNAGGITDLADGSWRGFVTSGPNNTAPSTLPQTIRGNVPHLALY